MPIIQELKESSVTKKVAVGTSTIGIVRNKISLTSTEYLGVELFADLTNTATIYVGDASVTTNNGRPMIAGQSLGLSISDLSEIYAVSGAINQKIRWIALTDE